MTCRHIMVICLTAALTGCGGVPVEVNLQPDLSRQVQQAISAVNDFSSVVDRTPENLRTAAFKVIDKLKIEGSDFLANDARKFTDHTLGSAGAVVKGSFTYAEKKMTAYMEALKKALEEALPKVKAEKSRDKAIELLRNLKLEVKPLDPFVELVNPNTLAVKFVKTYTGEVRDVEFSGKFEVSGHGLLRPDDESTPYRFQVIGPDQKARDIPATVSPAGPFVATVDLKDFKPQEGDQEVRCYWGETKLFHVGFTKTVKKDDPPPPKQRQTLTVEVNVRGDKDAARKTESIDIPAGWHILKVDHVIKEAAPTKNEVDARSNGDWTVDVDRSDKRVAITAWARSRPFGGTRRGVVAVLIVEIQQD